MRNLGNSSACCAFYESPPERSRSSVLGQGSPSLSSPLCPSVNFGPGSTPGSIFRMGKEKRSEGQE